MISIREAIDQKISRLRQPQWANAADHIELNLLDDGLCGPWVKLWSDALVHCGFSNPHKLVITEFDMSKKEWQPYPYTS